jgi:hypothetical protein
LKEKTAPKDKTFSAVFVLLFMTMMMNCSP